jgi:hypothetical protein
MQREDATLANVMPPGRWRVKGQGEEEREGWGQEEGVEVALERTVLVLKKRDLTITLCH